MSEEKSVFDLVIVGGGLAGLVAGVHAADLGLRAVILEQGSGVDYPCNARQSGGIVHIGFHDRFRPPHELIEIMTRMTDGEARPELVKCLAENGARLITWLQNKGARFMRFNQQEGYRWCLAPPRSLRAGVDWENRGPDQLLRSLAQQFLNLGGVLELRTRALELIMNGKSCIGVKSESEGVSKQWFAPQCLLADGGFQSNQTLFERFIGPNFDTAFQRGARTGRGSGLKMAVEAGAALVGTHRFYGHVLCSDARHNDRVWPYPEVDAIATAGIVVNGEGARIVDEGRTGVYVANALSAFPATTRFYAIFDQSIWEGPGASARIPANPLLEQGGGTVLRADSLRELAAKIGVDAAALEATVRDYNHGIDTAALDALAVPRSSRITPHRISTAPFMAIPICPGITYTMGGLAIDERAQVIDTRGEVMPGLLAAGATTGGLEGGENAVYLGGLIKAGVFGLIAAEQAARLQGKVAPAAPRADAQATPEAVPEAVPQAPTQTALPSSAATAKSLPSGLARFPILSAMVRYGSSVAIGGGVVLGLLICLAGWHWIGALSVVIGAIVGGIVCVGLLALVELIKLITELLIPG
jgi:fumarate reductase flavoprotein subunit